MPIDAFVNQEAQLPLLLQNSIAF